MRALASSTGHGETLERLLDTLSRRGLTVFAQIDHAAAARSAGLELRDEMVVVFGNPRAGTLLMQQDPRVGIELPLRLLVWDDGDRTLVGYNDPHDLADQYDLAVPSEILAAMASLLDQVAHEAASDSRPG